MKQADKLLSSKQKPGTSANDLTPSQTSTRAPGSRALEPHEPLSVVRTYVMSSLRERQEVRLTVCIGKKQEVHLNNKKES